MVRLAVVGGGRMGSALVGGLLTSGWARPADLAVVEVVPAARQQAIERFPGVQVVDAPVLAEGCVIAVKPDDAEAACRAVAASADKEGAGLGRVLSIAAGVTLARLEGALGPGVPVVRAMPNTPALVGAGAAAIAAGKAAGDADLAWARSILGAVGTVVEVPERLLDAVTGLSGSGPAYLFMVAEAMIDAGVLVGLPREVSAGLAVQTLVGAGRLLAETGEAPEALRAAVTSPGGTTAAGLRVLEDRGVRAAILAAVAAATDRSRQLGEG
jgi:pyrroline-5-carboxylate reductase